MVARCRPARLMARAAPRPTAAKNSTGSVVSRPAVAVLRFRVSCTSESTPPRLLMGTRNDSARTTSATSGSQRRAGRAGGEVTIKGCCPRGFGDDFRVPVSGTHSAWPTLGHVPARRVGWLSRRAQGGAPAGQGGGDAGCGGVDGAGVPGGLEAADRAGDADPGQDLVVTSEDGCGDAGDADGRLLVLERDPAFDDFVELASQHRCGSRWCAASSAAAGSAEDLLLHLCGRPGEEGLADRGGVHRHPATDPGGGVSLPVAAHLGDVDDLVLLRGHRGARSRGCVRRGPRGTAVATSSRVRSTEARIPSSNTSRESR